MNCSKDGNEFRDRYIDIEETTPLNPQSFSFYNYEEEVDVPITSTCINHCGINSSEGGKKEFSNFPALLVFLISSSFLVLLILFGSLGKTNDLLLKSAAVGTWSSAKVAPFSTVDPTTIGFDSYDRPSAKPGPIFAKLFEKDIPLPTNSWYENFLLGVNTNTELNAVFQVPYILDTGGKIPGIRVHPCYVLASAKQIMMTHEVANGITLGAVETFEPQNLVHPQGSTLTKLAIELEWSDKLFQTSDQQNTHNGIHGLDEFKTGSGMRSPIVRGSPYISMMYYNATPRIYTERIPHPHISHILIDHDLTKSQATPLRCGTGVGNYSQQAVRVEKELQITFDTSDMTWILFFSEPTEVVCASFDIAPYLESLHLPPGVVLPADKYFSFFDLKATKPMTQGMVRIAMVNNCTTGQNVQYCGPTRQPQDQSAFATLLRAHANVYPTARADVEFTFPHDESLEEDELRLIFNWHPRLMSQFASRKTPSSTASSSSSSSSSTQGEELLLFALPHHQERMQSTSDSTNQVIMSTGCMPTLHGLACPVIGNKWSLLEHLHRTSFSAANPPQPDMLSALQKAIKTDLQWQIPRNYQVGAGDTYFSGKLLARLARILIIADELHFQETEPILFAQAVHHLQASVEIWLNGSAQSRLLYDPAWHGIIMCGCNYAYDLITHGGGYCQNTYPYDCPALVDMGQNFGAGFYNDHHYHFGYHIYAAAVVAKFHPTWGIQFYEHVLMLIRDIANPSDEDKFFPTWRHKDWYVGFSWASGIVTLASQQFGPYPNGRNQESVSEAIAAYEAIALYGDVMAMNFFQLLQQSSSSSSSSSSASSSSSSIKTSSSPSTEQLIISYQNALRMKDMGRLLMATEIRSARTYWHVQQPHTLGVSRIYPDVYEPKVVGMIWSTLAQEQTWFGNEEWKSYGIQLLPITPAAELRDDPSWVQEMLPYYQASCLPDPICVREGWSVVIYTSLAILGDWHTAWQGIESLDPKVFDSAGGNGHSLSNTLWFIATRPTPFL